MFIAKGIMLREGYGLIVGGVGGGRRGIGKTAFMASMDLEELMDIHDGDRVSEVVLIGALDAVDFRESVAGFVSRVNQFKKTV